jgi:E3 ubiquitin-protein ligase RAD18
MEELPDSTDWIKSSLPLFEPLEASLRCEVCKEFYENPVITTCSHTFCSLCIRRCISSDGKCPSCKNGCSAERLLPNFAVREIVNRFRAARPTALQLARESQENDTEAANERKRKLEDANVEDEGNTRRTRSRITRSSSRRSGWAVDGPIEVPDSEDDGDEEFIPDGMVACPMCSTPMKEEQVWSHTNICTGVKKPARERSSRAK